MYSSITDLLNDIAQETLIQLVNDENEEVVDLGNQDSPAVKRINNAIEDAGAEIDGYLRSLYSTPITDDTDPRINKLSRVIAKYNLFSRRNMDVPEGIENQYKMAVKDLEKIQEGTVKLNVQDSSLGSKESDLFITDKASSGRFFNEAMLRNIFL